MSLWTREKIVSYSLGSWNQIFDTVWSVEFRNDVCCSVRYERKSYRTLYVVNSENIHVGRPIADWQKIEFSTVMCWIQKRCMLFHLVSVREKILFYTLGSWNQKWYVLIMFCFSMTENHVVHAIWLIQKTFMLVDPLQIDRKSNLAMWCVEFRNDVCCSIWFQCERKSYFTP